jgi:hypothetical protein
MKLFACTLVLGLLIVAMPMAASASDAAAKTEWADLIPKHAPAENPFAALSDADKADLRLLARERDSTRMGMKLTEEALAATSAAGQRLQARKIDADKLLAERERLVRERDQAAKGVVPELAGKALSLAGYMLPLEYKGDKVSEFLLVPWVGACIHTPPPPPNQVVYVKPAEPVEAKGPFTPVWISGKFQVQNSQRNLQWMDGVAPVDTSYSMIGAEIRPFQKP